MPQRLSLPEPPGERAVGLAGKLRVVSVILTLGAAMGGTTAAPSTASAQGIFGHVYDQVTGDPIEVAEVIVTHDSTGAASRGGTDEFGRFEVTTGLLGHFSVSVERLGYASGVSASVELTEAEPLEVEVVVTPDAVDIPGLVVNQTMLVARLRNEGYYRRKREGVGAFIEPTQEDLDFRVRIDEMIRRRASGVRIIDDVAVATRGRGRPCPLKLILDGADTNQIRLDSRLQFAAKRIQAIEVYWSPNTVPAQWRQAVRLGVVTSSGVRERVCGIILVWSK